MILCTKDKKTHEDSASILCVLLVEEICVCSGCIVQIARLCRSVRLLLVACCLLLVACCLLLVAKNCVRHCLACQVLLQPFMRFCLRIFVFAVISVFFCH